jgi:hypothetical protein
MLSVSAITVQSECEPPFDRLFSCTAWKLARREILDPRETELFIK